MFSHNAPAAGVRELFQPSKDAERIVVSIFLNWEVLDLSFFLGDVTIGSGLDIF